MFQSVTIILLSIVMSSFAHLFLKRGAGQFANDFGLENLQSIFVNYWVIGGILLHVSALIVWLWALSRVDITFAYPFLALGYIIVSIVAVYWLGEILTVQKIAGMSLIVSGLIVLSYGAT